MIGRLLGRWSALLGAVATLSVSSGCVVVNDHEHGSDAEASWDNGVKETRTILMDHVAQKPLHVQAVNGSISVAKSKDASVSITAKIRAQTDERLKATQIVAKRLDDGTLDIKVKWPDDKHKGNEGVSFEVAMPDAKDLKLDASNGSISVSGMGGKAVLGSSNGSITVMDHDGVVKADTSNGSVSVSNATGQITADTSNGAVSIKDAASPVKVNTSNGSIDVSMKPEAQGPVHLDTSNGWIKLAVGSSFSGVLKADTSNGPVSVNGIGDAKVSKGRSSAKIRFTDSGSESVLDTSNASIDITRR